MENGRTRGMDPAPSPCPGWGWAATGDDDTQLIEKSSAVDYPSESSSEHLLASRHSDAAL